MKNKKPKLPEIGDKVIKLGIMSGTTKGIVLSLDGSTVISCPGKAREKHTTGGKKTR